MGPCTVLMEGIVGEGVELNAEVLEALRESEMSYHLARRLLFTRFRDPGEDPPMHLFGDIKRAAKRWLDEGFLVAKGVPKQAVMYAELAEKAAERIYLACQRGVQGEHKVKAILDAYNPVGTTRFVAFNTTKDVYVTDPAKSHVSHVVCDSDWEGELARVLERNPRVLSYVKNQGMQFEVPYRDGAVPRRYIPDFIIQVDDGRDEPLNLIIETKGFKGGDAQLKAETMRTMWVEGVNNLGGYGRWRFEEFRDVYAIQEAFDRLIEDVVAGVDRADAGALV